jgi:DNA/RNA-binding domain of Phe-tRNA-synthetase-like protein
MRLFETVPGMGERRIKENDGEEIQLLYILRTLINVTLYPQYNTFFKRLKIKEMKERCSLKLILRR